MNNNDKKISLTRAHTRTLEQKRLENPCVINDDGGGGGSGDDDNDDDGMRDVISWLYWKVMMALFFEMTIINKLNHICYVKIRFMTISA